MATTQAQERQEGRSEKTMKQPYCILCGKCFCNEYYLTAGGGEMVKFADYIPLPLGYVGGHPWGEEWFCNEHLAAAQALAHHAVQEALAQLHQQFGVFAPPLSAEQYYPPRLWVTSVGPNRARVFSIIRQARGCTPAEAKALLEKGKFVIVEDWFEPWEQRLVEAGAQVERRYDEIKTTQ